MSTLPINTPDYLLPVLDNSLIAVQDLFVQFINSLDFESQVRQVFGDNIDLAQAKFLVSELAKSNSSILPKFEIRGQSEINGAKGAFAITNNTLYLSREFLDENTRNIPVIAAVIVEELGHFIDSQLNTLDTSGDEGELFSDLVRGVVLSDGELQRIKAEDDSAIVTIDGQTFQIEQATVNLGSRQGYGSNSHFRKVRCLFLV
jgi:hypothetical protein